MSPPSTASEALPDASREHARWFAENVQPHEPALRAYLHRRYPDIHDVDDVVQESFLKTWLARQKGTLTSVKGFLFTVAGNAAISIFRRRKYISPANGTPDPSLLVADDDMVETICSRDELALVADTLAELPERCRAVAVLRLVRGLDSSAIAAELRISEETVRVQLARAMKKCAHSLRQRGVLPPVRP